MTHYMFRLILTLFLLVTSAHSEPGPDLKAIMQNLQRDATQIVEGLLLSDFKQIERAANGIANHPHIAPEQIQLIVAELGEEMPVFKAFDTSVHNRAVSIRTSAQNSDTAKIAEDYKAMLDGCLSCHTAFLKRVSAALQKNADP